MDFIELGLEKRDRFAVARQFQDPKVGLRLRVRELATMAKTDHAMESAMEALLHLDAIVANTYYYDDRPEPAITWKCMVRYIERIPIAAPDRVL